jgi:cell division septation protein DedD
MFMEFKIGKDSGDSQPGEAPGEKKKQSALLILLLILVGGFTYIYFFTGLIKPLEDEKTAEAPVAAAPQIVKMPLPAREGEAAKPAKTAGNAETPKVVAAAPVTATAPAAKPAAAPAAKTAPAPAPSKPKEEPKKAEAAKPAEKKSHPAGVAENRGEVKKPVVADKKGAPAKDAVKKPATDTQAKPETATKKTTNDAWTLVVGNYVLEEALSADMGRVRKAGFQPIVKPSSRKKSAMNRLLVSEFSDRASALSSLEKLKRHTSDAFVIEQGGKFAVYAGSYLQVEAANAEKDRLDAAGFSITIKHTDIAIPSQSLAVGPFKNKKAADAALGKLKSVGIKATFSQK